MSQIETVKPTMHEGIELYVSSDGKECGMSIRGLAAFIGKAESILRQRILPKLDDAEVRANELPESLKPFVGKAFNCDIKGFNGAKIIPAKTCEAIIFYYAFEKQDETALAAYRKFAQFGLEQWIKKAVGHIEDQNHTELLSLVKEVLTEVKELRQVSTEYKAIREKTVSYMPGANDLLDEIQKQDDNLLAPADGVFEDGAMSLESWLFIQKGLILEKAQFYRLAKIVADTYRSLVKEDPIRRACKLNGRTKYNVSVYKREHFPILQIALNKCIN